MRIVIGVIAIIISLILIAAAMWEFFNTEDEEMKEEKYGDSYGEQFRKYEEKIAKAKEIISEWLRLHNSNTKKTIIKKSENFLKENT